MGKHINFDVKTNILILDAKGKGPSSISKQLKMPKMTVYNFIKRVKNRGTVYNNYHGGNKPLSIDKRTERHLVRTALANRRYTTRKLKEMLELDCDLKTIRNYFKKNDIRARQLTNGCEFSGVMKKS